MDGEKVVVLTVAAREAAKDHTVHLRAVLEVDDVLRPACPVAAVDVTLHGVNAVERDDVPLGAAEQTASAVDVAAYRATRDRDTVVVCRSGAGKAADYGSTNVAPGDSNAVAIGLPPAAAIDDAQRSAGDLDSITKGLAPLRDTADC